LATLPFTGTRPGGKKGKLTWYPSRNDQIKLFALPVEQNKLSSINRAMSGLA